MHRNTAFRWRHRFLALPNEQKATSLVGIAEADETFFLESFKGKKQGMARAPRKRGGTASKRGLSYEQIPVLIWRDRTESTTDFVLEKADKTHIGAALKLILASDAVLCTDSGKGFGAAALEMGIAHRPINLAAGIRQGLSRTKRQCLRQPSQNLDTTFPRCGYALPSQLSRLAQTGRS